MGRFDAVFNNVEQIRKRLAATKLMTLKVEEGKLRAYYPSPRQMRFNREEVSQLLLEEAKRRGLTIHTIGRGDCECHADTVLTCPIYQPGGGRCQSDGPGEVTRTDPDLSAIHNRTVRDRAFRQINRRCQ